MLSSPAISIWIIGDNLINLYILTNIILQSVQEDIRASSTAIPSVYIASCFYNPGLKFNMSRK